MKYLKSVDVLAIYPFEQVDHEIVRGLAARGQGLHLLLDVVVERDDVAVGLSGFTQERAGVKETSDLADVDPFLTKIESCEPSASLMPMHGEFEIRILKTPAFASSKWWPLGFGDWFGSICREGCL
jgi:hypothetical protein